MTEELLKTDTKRNAYIQRFPKIELHCHLDGSMDVLRIQQMLEQSGEVYSKEELQKQLIAPMDCKSLAEYLTRFDLPIRCLQTSKGLEAAAYDLAKAAASEQVRYLEARFAPSFHTAEGMSIRDVIESVQKGLLRAKQEFGIFSGILVCGMRHLPMEQNLSMLRQARELFLEGVVGCDLAGDEKAFPTKDFVAFFEQAKRYGMPFTIHSGECGSTKNIQVAMELGARRLGHGIAMAKDLSLMNVCAKQRIGVELCPTSNLQTKAVLRMEEYPFLKFYEAGIPLSVNTDNRTVSDTTCTKELELLAEYYPMTGDCLKETLQQIYKDSVEMSFAEDSVKHTLLGYIQTN